MINAIPDQDAFGAHEDYKMQKRRTDNMYESGKTSMCPTKMWRSDSWRCWTQCSKNVPTSYIRSQTHSKYSYRNFHEETWREVGFVFRTNVHGLDDECMWMGLRSRQNKQACICSVYIYVRRYPPSLFQRPTILRHPLSLFQWATGAEVQRSSFQKPIGAENQTFLFQRHTRT